MKLSSFLDGMADKWGVEITSNTRISYGKRIFFVALFLLSPLFFFPRTFHAILEFHLGS